jgi:hypothetical protein
VSESALGKEWAKASAMGWATESADIPEPPSEKASDYTLELELAPALLPDRN